MPLSSTKSLLRRRAAALLLVAAVLPVAATGCGGGDDENGNSDDATALIDKAFSNSIKSADVKLDAELKVQGVQGLGDTPIQLSASGPYIGGQNKLPQLDMDVKLGARGQGQSLETGLVSTGDRAFVKFGGEFYEQPKANVDAANRDLAKQKGSRDNALGIDPGSWITDAKTEGDDKVGGVDTTHVSARVDVEKLLADLNELARKGAGAVGGATAPQPLTRAQLADAAKTVKDPTFDVYVAKDDETIRRMSGNARDRRARGRARPDERHHGRLTAVHARDERRERRPEGRGAGEVAPAVGPLAPARRCRRARRRARRAARAAGSGTTTTPARPPRPRARAAPAGPTTRTRSGATSPASTGPARATTPRASAAGPSSSDGGSRRPLASRPWTSWP